MPVSGELVSKNSAALQFYNNITTVIQSLIVWHSGSYPPNMPDVIALSPQNLPDLLASVNGIIANLNQQPANAFQMANLFTTLCVQLARIRRVRYRRILQLDAGGTSVTYDATALTSLTSTAYQQIVNNTQASFNIGPGTLMHAPNLNNFVQNLFDQWNSLKENVIGADFVYCHCLSVNKSFVHISYMDNDSFLVKKQVAFKELEVLVKTKDLFIATPDGYSKILEYYDKGVQQTYRVELYNGYKIVCTLEHKIFTSLTTSKPLKNLKVGDKVLTESGYSTIQRVTPLEIEKVADISVDNENHNFYCNGVLVSNSSCHCLNPLSTFVEEQLEDNSTRTISLQEIKGKYVKIKSINTWVNIVNWFYNGIHEIYKVVLEDNSFIECTKNHKLFINQFECKPLSELSEGSKIYTEKGIQKISSIDYVARMETVDIQVDNTEHNFYANGILTSNSSCHGSRSRR